MAEIMPPTTITMPQGASKSNSVQITMPTRGVAIIGMSCTLPAGINDSNALWNFIKDRRCATGPIPMSRFNASHFYHPAGKRGHFAVQGGSYLEHDINTFDAPFFSMTEAEATAMDPQQRLLLEGAFTAIENAGLDIRTLAGRSDVGVFAAGSKAESELGGVLDPFTASRYTATGTAMAMFANRLSYFFGFRGPSVVVDVACASSLTAFHLAAESIRNGECSTAIVGASFLQIDPTMITHLDSLGVFGKNGKCFSYDSRAEGYGRGEGVCCLVLRSETEARAAGDAIRALIRGSGIGHCGRGQGITLPNGDAQAELIRKVYKQAGLRPQDTVVVEGHGTGTPVGDPIELRAILASFGGKRTFPLHLASVKSNLGHLEAVSGILSVMKCVLMVERGTILPTANYEKPNPAIGSMQGLEIVTSCTPWPEHAPRRASVNNFGFGGANAHVILEGVTSPVDSPQADVGASHGARIFPVSAKDNAVLVSQLAKLNDHVHDLVLVHEADEDEMLQNLSYTLCCRRTPFDYQHAVVASTREELLNGLQCTVKPRSKLTSENAVFLFTGQGAQWAEMAMDLMNVPVFAKGMMDADRLVRELNGDMDLIKELAKPAAESRINDAAISQPALTAVQMSLVLLLRSFGMGFGAVCGHSSGEIAAAFAAGFLDFDTCMALAYYRGETSSANATGTGAMLAVGTSVDQIQHLLAAPSVTVACYNSPTSITLSGEREAILSVAAELDRSAIFNRVLNTGGQAYHSKAMVLPGDRYREKISPWLERTGNPVESSHTALFFSSVRETLQPREAVQSAEYWVTNLVSPVKFSGAMSTAMSHVHSTTKGSLISLVEVGPHSALAGPIRDICKANGKAGSSCKYISTLLRKQHGRENMLKLASSLMNEGFALDASAIWRGTTEANAQPKLLTDLPPYQFNKTTSYKNEPGMLHSAYFGTSPWHVLLGHKQPFTTDGRIEFRNVFTLDDIPWLRDHFINGSAVFPMAGYTAAVIEALAFINEAKSNASQIVRFKVRDMVIGRALRITEGVDCEMHTIVQPKDSGTRGSVGTAWHSFRVLSWSKTTGYVEHCSGIAASVVKEDEDVINSTFASSKLAWSQQVRSSCEQDSDREVDCKAFYREVAEAGMEYGPTFQGLTSLRTGPNSAVGTVTKFDTAKLMPAEFETKLKVHPAWLDACLHVGVCHTAGSSGRFQAFVPTFVEEMIVSAEVPQEENETSRLYYHDIEDDVMSRTTTANITGFATGQDLPVLELRGLKLVNVSEREDHTSQVRAINPHKVEWVDHPDFMTSESLADIVAEIDAHSDESKKISRLNDVAVQYMEAALNDSQGTPTQEHLATLKNWMTRCLQRASEDVVVVEPDELETVERTFTWINSIGPHLPSILEGKVDGRDALQEADPSAVYEESFVFQRSAAISARLLRNLSMHKPSLRILEVGAGAGTFASRALDELSGGFAKYVYTDVSQEKLDSAKTKFAKWQSQIEFLAFDPSLEPSSQGLELGSFDVVVAADVVGASISVDRALQNVRSLLKPGGFLAMIELDKFAPLNLPFALLPGCWNRACRPVLSTLEWHDYLLQAGFKDSIISARDWPQSGQHNIFWAQATASPVSTSQKLLVVVGSTDDRLRSGLAVDTTFVPSLDALDAADMPDRHIICLESMTGPSLAGLEEQDFSHLQQLVGNAAGILWVVQSSSSRPDDAARAGFVQGFARTIRTEYANLKFVVLHLIDAEPNAAEAIVGQVYQHAFVDKPGVNESEIELEWKQGHLRFPRLIPEHVTEDFIDQMVNPARTEIQPFWQKDQPLHATLHQLGSLDSVQFAPLSFGLNDALGEEEVLLEIRATGLNFKDVLLCLGRVPWQDIGLECSGVVVSTGSKAAASWRKGDRVALFGRGGLFGSHVRCSTDSLVRVPEHISFSEAASTLLVFGTAYEGLVNFARIQPGEKILIHAAAGGVGQAAIILCQHIGAEIYCTVGTSEKRELLNTKYGIPSDRVFSSRTAEFSEGLQLATGGGGVDIVLNSLGGDLLKASWACLAPGGRFVEIGKRDMLSNAPLDMSVFDKAVTFGAVDLALLGTRWPKKASALMRTVMTLFEQKKLYPVSPVTEYSISELVPALRLLQSGKHVGKVVVTNNADARVAVRAPRTGKAAITANATYLITGGTGGLGRSLARWFIDQGARNIILVSRSGGTRSDELSALLNYAAGHGAKISLSRCDASVRSSIELVLDSAYSRGFPAVRGIVHAAAVFKDALFETSTHSDWTMVQSAKMQAALNLHHIFDKPGDLDFFICLGSIVGISGNMGQASYGGANASLDSLCRWRGEHGMCGISIDLPGISDVGHIAEKSAAGEGTFNAVVSSMTLDAAQVHLVMAAAVQKDCYTDGRTSNQIAIGLSSDQEHQKVYSSGGPLFTLLTCTIDEGSSEEQSSVRQLLTRESNQEAKQSILLNGLTQKISSMMMVPVEDLKPGRAIADFGLDSLVAVELRNFIAREFSASVPVMDIVGSVSLQSLADLIASRSSLMKIDV